MHPSRIIKTVRDITEIPQTLSKFSSAISEFNGSPTGKLVLLYPCPAGFFAFKALNAVVAGETLIRFDLTNFNTLSAPIEFFLDRLTSAADSTADRVLFTLSPSGAVACRLALSKNHRFQGNVYFPQLTFK